MTASPRPLGVRPALKLTSEQSRQLEVLAAYNLDFAEDRILSQGLLPASWVEEAVLEFRRFVALRVIYGTGIGMFSPYVDEVWHQCILFTREYFEFSDAVAGEYLHHAPNTGDDPVDEDPGLGSPGDAPGESESSGRDVSAGTLFDEFVDMYERTFDGAIPEFWSRHKSVGG